jgi:hypothetical protein
MDILNPAKDADALATAAKPLLQMTLADLAEISRTLFDGYTITCTVKIEKKPTASTPIV